MACAYWQCVSTVTLAPEAAARIARPWLQKANAPFTGSLPGAGSQYPDVVTQVLSSSMRTEPGPATLSARLLAGLRPHAASPPGSSRRAGGYSPVLRLTADEMSLPYCPVPKSSPSGDTTLLPRRTFWVRVRAGPLATPQ